MLIIYINTFRKTVANIKTNSNVIKHFQVHNFFYSCQHFTDVIPDNKKVTFGKQETPLHAESQPALRIATVVNPHEGEPTVRRKLASVLDGGCTFEASEKTNCCTIALSSEALI